MNDSHKGGGVLPVLVTVACLALLAPLAANYFEGRQAVESYRDDLERRLIEAEARLEGFREGVQAE